MDKARIKIVLGLFLVQHLVMTLAPYSTQPFPPSVLRAPKARLGPQRPKACSDARSHRRHYAQRAMRHNKIVIQSDRRDVILNLARKTVRRLYGTRSANSK
jgi:hypothetical protein